MHKQTIQARDMICSSKGTLNMILKKYTDMAHLNTGPFRTVSGASFNVWKQHVYTLTEHQCQIGLSPNMTWPTSHQWQSFMKVGSTPGSHVSGISED